MKCLSSEGEGVFSDNCFFFQAIFMIPTNPPPTFRKPDQWSESFQDFIKKCLEKNPERRATATQLLQVKPRETPEPLDWHETCECLSARVWSEALKIRLH